MDVGSYGDLAPITTRLGVSGSRKARKKRSRVMYLNQLTYEKLKTKMQERLGQSRLPKASSFPNSLSALNEFLRERGIEPGT